MALSVDGYAPPRSARFPTVHPFVPPTLPGEHGTSGGADAYGNTPTVYVNPPPPGPGGGGGGSGPDNPPLDWHAYLVNWGFDQETVTELDRIFRTYADPSQAAAAGLAFIRGTQWYARTFPGIQEGLNKGILSNETDYRAYVNGLNQTYQQYLGRNTTVDDVTNALARGWTVDRASREFLANADYNALSPLLANVFSGGELQGIAQGQAGIGDANAQKLYNLSQTYLQLAPIYNQYGKTLDRTELERVNATGKSPELVGREFLAGADLSALSPRLSGVFSQDELQQIANGQAGIGGPNSQRLFDLSQTYLNLAPVYSQYGRPLSRAELEQADAAGLTPTVAGQQFGGDAYANANRNDIQYLAGAFSPGRLSDPELQAYGREKAGLDTFLGQEVQRRLDMARQRFEGVFKGVLATPALSLTKAGRIQAPGLAGGRSSSDVAA